MRILITGICGFAGSTLAQALAESNEGLEVFGIDNFSRPGSEFNRRRLHGLGIRVQFGDIRNPEDLQTLPRPDWMIDAAANPSVLAGTSQNAATSNQLLQHNLVGTVNMLEFCRTYQSGFILLSTSRVYSISLLNQLKLQIDADAFRPRPDQCWPVGASLLGIAETFSAAAPISLYGASKLCSEILASEYAQAFDFPIWINRLGVLAGAGQFGRADQGIFSYWIHGYAAKKPLKFMGFGGHGYQVRDCIHPRDLTEVLCRQMKNASNKETAMNFSGGIENSISLRQLHQWCECHFGKHPFQSQPADRPYDVPWLVLDSSAAKNRFGWRPQTKIDNILEEIAEHAEKHPDWLDWTAS
jgi:CDP-paratose 2-epimerase